MNCFCLFTHFLAFQLPARYVCYVYCFTASKHMYVNPPHTQTNSLEATKGHNLDKDQRHKVTGENFKQAEKYSMNTNVQLVVTL